MVKIYKVRLGIYGRPVFITGYLTNGKFQLVWSVDLVLDVMRPAYKQVLKHAEVSDPYRDRFGGKRA